MNRKFFFGLVGMMILSVAGITWVQITWLKNAIGVRNENFNNAVFSGLNNAAGEIESLRKMNSFNNFMLNPPLQPGDSSGHISQVITYGSSYKNDGGRVSINIRNSVESIDSKGRRKELVVSRDTVISDNTSISFSGRLNGENLSPGVESSVSTDTGISIVVEQKEFLEWVQKRSSDFRDISNRVLYEMYEAEKARIPEQEEVVRVLNHIFPYYGINTPFEAAILNDGELSANPSKKVSKTDFLKSIYKVRLNNDSFFRNDLLLSVVFPEKNNFLFGSMAWMLGGSFLFSLFIFSTFGLSLFFIIRQKKISDIKSDFLNNMTHEFKTPIATISLAADTITNPRVINDEMSIRHFIGMIKKENSRMNKQVETILQIASLDKKEIDFRFTDVSVHSVIIRAIETIEIQVIQRNGFISQSLCATKEIISGDAEHLTNLLHNLLDNAIKYSKDKPEILVSTQNHDDGLLISVEDKGIGMSRSVQSKIFERFYRQASGDIHDVKGFGLGLNYVKAIVDAHKGRINVTSEPGQGSRFDIYLPFKQEN